MPVAHKCHACECEVEVPPNKLFCSVHWRLTPTRLQRQIYRYYRPGQEILKNPTFQYLMTMQLCIAYVAKHEGKDKQADLAYENAKKYERLILK